MRQAEIKCNSHSMSLVVSSRFFVEVFGAAAADDEEEEDVSSHCTEKSDTSFFVPRR